MTLKETIEDILIWIKRGEDPKPLMPLYTEEELKELERDKGLDQYR